MGLGGTWAACGLSELTRSTGSGRGSRQAAKEWDTQCGSLRDPKTQRNSEPGCPGTWSGPELSVGWQSIVFRLSRWDEILMLLSGVKNAGTKDG